MIGDVALTGGVFKNDLADADMAGLGAADGDRDPTASLITFLRAVARRRVMQSVAGSRNTMQVARRPLDSLPEGVSSTESIPIVPFIASEIADRHSLPSRGATFDAAFASAVAIAAN
jgi:hypothetical protein